MTEALLASCAVPAFAAIDRLWGAPKGKLPAKILAGATIATLFLIDWKLAAMGAAIVIGRSIGFADGVATGKNVLGLSIRSSVPLVLAGVFTLEAIPGRSLAAWALVPHFIATILLALWYGKRIDQEPWNVQRALEDNMGVELARGAFAGLGVALYAVARSVG